MTQRITIGDIARQAGVSKGAVSFALNGRPGVSDQTRARIVAIAERMNWRPHSAARALGRSRAQLVGVVWARPARTLGVEPFFAQMVSGLQAGLATEAVGLQLMIVEDTATEIGVYRRWSSERRVDGVVLFDLRVRDPRIATLEELGLPCIVLGGPGDHGALPNVWVDDRAAMRIIVEHLVTLGHRRIAHVAGIPALQHTQRRMRALRDAARGYSLDFTRSYPTDFSDAEGAAATRLALAETPAPTAVVYDSDVMAVAGLAEAMHAGLSVPDDLSIAAFDDSALTRMMHPAITALTRDTFKLGQELATGLLQVIADPDAIHSVKAPTPTLVARESTAGAQPAAGRGRRR